MENLYTKNMQTQMQGIPKCMSPTFTGEDGSVNPRLCSSRVSSKGARRSGLAPCRAANLEI